MRTTLRIPIFELRRRKATHELKKLRLISPMSAEGTVVRNYLDWLLSIPWNKKSKTNKDLVHAQQILDHDHYGLEKVKERIVEYLAVQQRANKLTGPILCLVGLRASARPRSASRSRTPRATLLRTKRIELHARIARVLDQQFLEIKENNPEVLARHYTEGGLAPQAIDYWQRAGNRAAKRSANQEAVAHFQRGRELLDTLSDKAAFAEQELQLLIALGPALMTTKTSSAPDIGGVYARAGELARQTGRLADLFPTVWGAWLVAFASGDFAATKRLVDELFSIASSTKETAFTLQAHHAAWPTLWVTGFLAEARQHIASGLAFYRRDAHSEQAFQYGGHDPSVCGHATEALIATAMGYPARGAQQMEEALRVARELDHVPTLIHGLWCAAELYQIAASRRRWKNLRTSSFRCSQDEFGRLLDGLFGLCAPSGCDQCSRRPAAPIEEIDRVRHQTSSVRRAAVSVNRRQVTSTGGGRSAEHDGYQKRIVAHYEAVNVGRNNRGEARFEFRSPRR